ncbi:PilW family protein [Biformimicrobium ophioploci]|nr:PilW family protein [Microbulbifer sp. NKW57]
MSLVELMVGILLASLLLLGVIQIFDGNKRTQLLQYGFARAQESGRLASDFMALEIRNADYWGCAPGHRNHLKVPPNVSSEDADPDWDGELDLGNRNRGVIGLDNVTGEQVGAYPVVDGTDILTLRGTSGFCTGSGKHTALKAAAFHVAPNCELEQGDIVLLSDCDSGELFSITGVQQGGPGNSGKKTIQHHVGNNNCEGCVDNETKEFQKFYGIDAEILRPVTRTFFISASTIGEGNSLYLSENGQILELVPNVDDMQLLYGRDTTGNKAVDTWLPAPDPSTPGYEANMQQAIAIRAQFTVNSAGRVNVGTFDFLDLDENPKSYTDGMLHKTYTVVSKIRNRGQL